jgi:hypothetical protein
VKGEHKFSWKMFVWLSNQLPHKTPRDNGS